MFIRRKALLSKQQQVLRTDGHSKIVSEGMRRHIFRDIYYFFQTISWPYLLSLGAALWLLVVCLFACLYMLGGPCISGARDNSFIDAFFFSVQTLSTIGYGTLAPSTTYAHILVTLEALFGLLISAVLTGLIFAKFSTPTARILFAKHALITHFDGERVFMLRLANQRNSYVLEAGLRLTMLRDYTTQEGEYMRRFFDLELKRPETPVFSLGWTVFHVIDQSSPLYGMDERQMENLNVSFILIITGVDSTLAARVCARHTYKHTDILFNHRYVNTITKRDERLTVIDYNKFHHTEPLELDPSRPSH